ncbi:hypothetical protein BJ912DRAFT_985429, partial [Pholiota molesta]
FPIHTLAIQILMYTAQLTALAHSHAPPFRARSFRHSRLVTPISDRPKGSAIEVVLHSTTPIPLHHMTFDI